MGQGLTDAQKVAMIREVAAGGGETAQQAVTKLARSWGRDDGLRIIDIVRAEMAKDLSAALATPRPPGAGLDATAFIDTIEALWTARWRL